MVKYRKGVKMSRLPRTQPNSIALTESMIYGFTKYPDVFKSADIEILQQSLDSFYQAQKSYNDAEAMYKQAGKKQKNAFERLKSAIANQVKTAQVDTADEPVKIGLIGFGTRKKKSPVNLPASPIFTEITPLAEGIVKLLWKKQFKSTYGPTLNFTIESRRCQDGKFYDWQRVGSSFDCQAILKNQQKGTKLEYRIIAANRSGESYPSNTLTIIL
jgi:hypothetical protein